MAAKRAIAWLVLGLAAPLGLAGCGGGETPPRDFAPLSYAYLRPLRLNVGTVEVQNEAPEPNDVGAQSPAVPADALAQMARDRLIPAGASGRAVVTIQQAAITDLGNTLNGNFRLRLDIYTSTGQRAAFAEAAVARTAPAPDSDDQNAFRGALYDFTKAMMGDMNVELEFQLRRTLGDWLQSGTAGLPARTPVEAQPLPPPGQGATPGYRLVPSTPPAAP